MTDVREAILARLVEVVATIPNLRSAHRNNVDLTEDQLPAALVFDGDEETVAGNETSSQKSNRPLLVEMTPEIVITEQSKQVTDLATLRLELIKRVLFDTELNTLIGGNGKISYVSCQTDAGWMRSLNGLLRAQFTFKYPLKPDEL